MKSNFFFLIPYLILLVCYSQEAPYLKVGLVADTQYANKSTSGKRYYRESLWKLQEAIDTFNHQNIDLVQNLGDVIDAGWESYDAILPIYNQLKPSIKNYQLLGNHEFSIDPVHFKELLKRLSMPNYYYSYSKKGWRFIVLDATDYSYYSNELHNYDMQQIDSYFQKTKNQSNHQRWNSAIGRDQQNWLRKELDLAQSLHQKVILFSHMPLRPKNDSHNLWNDHEIINIIEGNNNVVAFINGHNHSGNYEIKKGIHYITVFGMVDTKISSYGILEFYKDSLILRGYGNQKNIRIEL